VFSRLLDTQNTACMMDFVPFTCEVEGAYEDFQSFAYGLK
jgi:hypothetical protein